MKNKGDKELKEYLATEPDKDLVEKTLATCLSTITQGNYFDTLKYLIEEGLANDPNLN